MLFGAHRPSWLEGHRIWLDLIGLFGGLSAVLESSCTPENLNLTSGRVVLGVSCSWRSTSKGGEVKTGLARPLADGCLRGRGRGSGA